MIKLKTFNIWLYLVQWTKFLIFCAFLVLLCIVFIPIIRKIDQLEKKKELLSKEYAEAQLKNKELSRKLDLLKHDPGYIERMARDRLNMGKPGEIIFRFDPYGYVPVNRKDIKKQEKTKNP
ncbi:FtsB family cell division protein [Methylacidiphilum caldifontis]|uniref:Septum formation initiator n=1 Tax=Methylacidiphilum caldifontis TaxID=2795386 RepID=A0A4Y8PFF3_9BACT|nr:septum formation initiator family protein [Methylacidiphilum caldifontis]QSR88263.1 septum formation initiator family protein [Methylacidiphilum caldifontis]TFE70577.1 septum formation initiator [Methylacidiphilum caldifontis]